MTNEQIADESQIEHLQRQIVLLREGLGWALAEGGWRLWYYANNVPQIIKIPLVGSPAVINERALARHFKPPLRPSAEGLRSEASIKAEEIVDE